MSKWLNIAALFAAVYLGLQWQQGNLIFARNPAGLTGNTCDGKKFCAEVYLAPWCPHCKSALPQTQALLDRSRFGDTGVKVIVGMGEPAQNQAMADRIGKNVATDDDLKIARAHKVQSVPNYLVFDAEGTQILDGQEAFAWVAEKFKR